MKKALAILLIAASLICLAGCVKNYPVEGRGTANIRIYNRSHGESEIPVTDPSEYNRIPMTITDSSMLKRFVNEIEWENDYLANREPFTFIGEFSFEKNDFTFYFTEDGTIYYEKPLEHRFGQISKRGLDLLLIFAGK